MNEDNIPADLDGISVLTSMVPELAREIEQAHLEASLSVEKLLSNLREHRELYYRDHYSASQFE